MRVWRYNWWAIGLCTLALTASVASGQQQQQTRDQGTAPIPAYRSPLASAADNQESEADSQGLASVNRIERLRGLTAYQNLLALCKDADPDVPIVKDPNAEYAKLR